MRKALTLVGGVVLVTLLSAQVVQAGTMTIAKTGDGAPDGNGAYLDLNAPP